MAKDNKNYKNISKIKIFLNGKKYFCTDLNSTLKIIKNDTKDAMVTPKILSSMDMSKGVICIPPP